MDNHRGQEMIRRFLFLGILFPVVFTIGCGQGHNKTEENKSSLLPGGPAWAALYQQQSGEYRALCYQAYNIASLRLEQKVKQHSALPKAIITDIDETVLDNSPYFVSQAKKGLTYSDSSWIAWTAQRKCDTLPGAVRFLKRAKELGVSVFYVTNRFAEERQATLANLKQFDLPDTDNEHLFLMDGGTSSKEKRRQGISKSHEVILLLGDNLGDFDRDFDEKDPSLRTEQARKRAGDYGDRFIVFPNAMYGTWEDVLYGKDEKSTDQKNAILTGLLK